MAYTCDRDYIYSFFYITNLLPPTVTIANVIPIETCCHVIATFIDNDDSNSESHRQQQPHWHPHHCRPLAPPSPAAMMTTTFNNLKVLSTTATTTDTSITTTTSNLLVATSHHHHIDNTDNLNMARQRCRLEAHQQGKLFFFLTVMILLTITPSPVPRSHANLQASPRHQRSASTGPITTSLLSLAQSTTTDPTSAVHHLPSDSESESPHHRHFTVQPPHHAVTVITTTVAPQVHSYQHSHLPMLLSCHLHHGPHGHNNHCHVTGITSPTRSTMMTTTIVITATSNHLTQRRWGPGLGMVVCRRVSS